MPVPNRNGLKIVHLDVKDHTDPNYSCAYVTVQAESGQKGFGLTFTCGRGTEIIVLCIRSMKRFIGPEKGVAHLAAAAILNALWDLWARLEKKPLWRLLTDMEPEELVSTIDFRYITDVITREEAIQLLRDKKAGKEKRINDELVKELCDKYLSLGFTHFKVKVGRNFEDDYRRCSAVRKNIGDHNTLKLAPLKPMWIEEPTSPDDVLGHATISKALAGGMQYCQIDSARIGGINEILSQFLQSGGMQYCQIDSARIGGINEILSYWDFASVCGTMQGRLVEYVDQQHEHFAEPCRLPGYSTEFLPGTVDKFAYPNG
ncbi:putative mandelate racemase, partial [Operophtera brumata]